jgi:hypothetical protein
MEKMSARLAAVCAAAIMMERAANVGSQQHNKKKRTLSTFI